MKFVKILGATILIICMVIALAYGLIDIAQLALDLGQTVEGTNLMTIWQPHLREITYSGLSLSVLFLGWKALMEYFSET